jgi:hypothetical protein
MINEDGKHFLHVYGYGDFEQQQSEKMWVVLGENGEVDGSVWPPMRWQHICITYDNKTGIIKISNQEKLTSTYSPKKANSTINIKAITLMKTIIIEANKTEDRDENDKSGSMVGRITDLNIWNISFSENEMTKWLNCKDTQKGNILAWESSSWILENVTESDLVMSEICKNDRLLIFPPAGARDSDQICKELGGDLFSSLSNDSVWEALKYKSQNNEICDWNLGTPIQLDHKKDVFINKDTGNEMKALNWEEGHPKNGYGYYCVSINEIGNYRSITCNGNLVCPVCQFKTNPQIMMRGTCENGFELDSTYSIDNVGSYDKFYTLKGSFRSKIYFDSGSWIIQDYIKKKFIAFQNDSLSYPFGTNKWTFFDGDCTEPGEQWKYLSLSTCNEDHFPCGDGECVLNTQKCDNKLDCADGTDEEGCKILQIPKSYAKDIPPASNLTVGINIIEIVDVSEAFNSITIRFRLYLDWKEARIKFRNLRQISDMNAVPDDEAFLLWMPQIDFPNLISDIKSEAIGIVYITKMLDAFEKVKEGVTITEVYEGSEHTITNEKQLSMQFTCFYKLGLYPFDTQSCRIGLGIGGIARLSMRKKTDFKI